MNGPAMCEVLLVAWPGDAPEPFARVLPWAIEMERYGVAGFGWGVAWLGGDGRVHGTKHPTRLSEDRHAREAIWDVTSARFLVHLRRPNRLSTIQPEDTQPFLQADGGFAFCHNGFFARADELRPAMGGRLAGRADSEVGFRLFEDLLRRGLEPPEALASAHRELQGTANMGYLGSDGLLLGFSDYGAGNVFWRFAHEGAAMAATSLHSMDETVFDLVFTGATGAEQLALGTAVVIGDAKEAIGGNI